MVLANVAARDRGHHFIGGPHVAIGLLEADRQSGSGLLAQLGVTEPDELRAALEAEADGEEAAQKTVKGPPGVSPPFTPGAKKALEMSLREALKLSQNWIGPGHMLLGLISSAASSVLVERLPLDEARDAVAAWEADQPVSEKGVGENSEGNETMAKGFSQVLKAAMAKAKPIGSQHLLLGMFETENTLARKALESLGVTKEKVTAAIDSIGTDGTSDESPQAEYEVRVGEHSIRVDHPESRDLLRGILEDDPELAARIRDAVERRARDAVERRAKGPDS